MGIFITVTVYLFGGVLFLYFIVCELLDTIGRLEIVKSRWPRLYIAMSNQPMRLVLLVFLIALVGKDLVDRAKVKRDIPALVVNLPAPPAPVVRMFPTTRPDHPSTSIKQTLVENHGQITGGQISGNTQISGTNSQQKQVGIRIGEGVHGRIPDIEDVHMCTGDDWKCFLNEEEVNAKSGDTAAFENTVQVFSRVVDLRGKGMAMRGNIDAKRQCHQKFIDAVAILRAHKEDESETIPALLSDPPVCLGQQ